MPTLSYKIEGRGEPVLLLHGMGVTYSIWKDLIPLLSPYYKLILVELPGNGAAPEADPAIPYYQACAEDLEALRQELGIERWDMLAYSLGAWVGQAALQCNPHQARRVVFLCPALFNVPVSQGLHALRALDRLFPGLASWLFSGWRLQRLVLLLGFNNHSHPNSLEWQAEIQSQPLGTLRRMLVELPGAGRAPFFLPALPVRFIWARRDFLTRRPRRGTLQDCFVDAAHSAPQLAAREVADHILAFFN